MIEILNKDDVKKVNDLKLKEYLEFSLNRLPSDFEYPEFGYFVIIENLVELQQKEIKLSNHILNGIDNGLYDDINMVEIRNEIVEIVLFLDNDKSVSLILSMKILLSAYKEELKRYTLCLDY